MNLVRKKSKHTFLHMISLREGTLQLQALYKPEAKLTLHVGDKVKGMGDIQRFSK